MCRGIDHAAKGLSEFVTQRRNRKAAIIKWQRLAAAQNCQSIGKLRRVRIRLTAPGEVLEVFVTKRRFHRTALTFLKRTMKRYGHPKVIVTDRLRSYRAAMNVIGNTAIQVCGRWINNRAENSHQPFRRREGAMAKFRDIKTLQKFSSAHASIHNHINHQRHLIQRDDYKAKREVAVIEWQQLCAS